MVNRWESTYQMVERFPGQQQAVPGRRKRGMAPDAKWTPTWQSRRECALGALSQFMDALASDQGHTLRYQASRGAHQIIRDPGVYQWRKAHMDGHRRWWWGRTLTQGIQRKHWEWWMQRVLLFLALKEMSIPDEQVRLNDYLSLGERVIFVLCVVPHTSTSPNSEHADIFALKSLLKRILVGTFESLSHTASSTVQWQKFLNIVHGLTFSTEKDVLYMQYILYYIFVC